MFSAGTRKGQGVSCGDDLECESLYTEKRKFFPYKTGSPVYSVHTKDSHLEKQNLPFLKTSLRQ